MKEWRSEGIRKEGRVISLSSRGILASGTAWSRDSKLSLGQDWFSLIFQLCSFRADSIYSQSLHWRREQQRKLIVNPQLFPLCFLYHKTSHLWLGTASWGKDRLSIPLLQLNMVVWPMAHKWKKRHEQFWESCPWWIPLHHLPFPYSLKTQASVWNHPCYQEWQSKRETTLCWPRSHHTASLNCLLQTSFM